MHAQRMSIALLFLLALFLLTFVGLAPAAETFDAASLEFFEKEVRPILVERCYACHSDKAKQPKGGLRLDSRAAVLVGGDTGPAVDFNDISASLLIDSINYGEIYQMPPKSKLPAAEIATLTKWVTMRAPWSPDDTPQSATQRPLDIETRAEEHWVWQPMKKVAAPNVRDASWSDRPIDRFIQAKLEEHDLSPSPRADRRTLIRRATFDLIGLPPTPEEVAAFIADESPNAYEKVLDRLLQSPHFGERWGRHWLDLVRYGESRGHEFDYSIANPHQYRDYVIRAFNADVPYDQFVTEHIAGDLVETPRLHPEKKFNESILGTGFWFLGEWVHSPVDIRKDETDRFDNMIDVFGKTFLGLTVACARCHDHKFDALSQADYYALSGYLQSSAYRQVRFDTLEADGQIASQLAKLRDEYRPQIVRGVVARQKPVLDRLEHYLLAAQDAWQADSTILSVRDGKFSTSQQEHINEAASSRQVSAPILARWLTHLAAAVDQPTDLLHDWAKMAASSKPAETRTQLQKLRTTAQQQATKAAQLPEGAEVVGDFGEPHLWMADGWTFGRGAMAAGLIRLSGDRQRPIAEILPLNAAVRDPFWNGLRRAKGTAAEPGRLSKWDRAGKAIRTPTFEISENTVHCLVQGTGHLYAVVDSHRMINGPLHGALLSDIKGDASTWRWHSHNVSRYKGHRVHLEFIATGDAPLKIAKVVQCDHRLATPAPLVPQPILDLLADETTVDAAKHAQQLAELLRAHAARLAEDRIGKDPSAIAIATWLVNHESLFTTEGAKPIKSAVEFAEKYEHLSASVQRESRTAMAMWEGSAENDVLLVRGNSRTPSEIVPRRTLTALGGQGPSESERGSGRLQLAKQLVSPDNPLAARVIVNRVWHHLFGRGIVASVDNMGVLGQPPTHPELLDAVAIDFVKDDWSVKRLIKRLMLSETYQMSSQIDPQAAKIDPDNQWLHRMRIRRLQAEAIRDSILAISGRLDRTAFGPSVPVYLTSFMQGRGRPGSGPIDGNGRRSIYISVRRNFLSPMMLAFDMPQPFNAVGRRTTSNVPAQALILMNDPLVVQQAETWAKRLLSLELEKPEQRIDRMYEEAFARPPSEDERSRAVLFVTKQGEQWKLSPEQAANDVRSWKDLCHVMMNVKEFIFIP